MIVKFTNHINKYHLFTKDNHLLIAISGGVDSVVLADLCAKAGYQFSIAHCNFQLRGEESERDEAFVKSLAAKYKVQLYTKRFNTTAFAAENKYSIQEAARKLRYGWFDELMNELKGVASLFRQVGASDGMKMPQTSLFLLTAHHLDDNIETSVMHFFRGTGIGGLRGMLPKQGKILRPLLFASKQDILAYANENNLQWVEDSSNESSKYTRNFFRNELLPMVEKAYPGSRTNLANNLYRFAETEELYRQAIQLHKKKLLEVKSLPGGNHEIYIPVLKLKKTTPLHTIVYEIIKDFGFTAAQTTDVVQLLDAENSKYVQSPTHRMIKNRNWLMIVPVANETAAHVLIEGTGEWAFAGGSIKIEQIKYSGEVIATDDHIATVDASSIEFPLLMRKWKTGDYFYPLGMKKKKKLARFFIDQKLSKTQKENVWVLESNQKIIWVVGYRIDERVKITSLTKTVLQFICKDVDTPV
jgi:tRNA(Ile)-lysidine synthase